MRKIMSCDPDVMRYEDTFFIPKQLWTRAMSTDGPGTLPELPPDE